jgi:sorbitol-specific phosphotransferase system component IIA
MNVKCDLHNMGQVKIEFDNDLEIDRAKCVRVSQPVPAPMD